METININESNYLRMCSDIEDYAIVMLDVNGNIQNWNKGAEKIKGYTFEEIIGKNFRVFYSAEDQAIHLPEQLIAEASKNGKAQHEGWRIKKDGSKFWGSIVITAIQDDNGILTGFGKITRDLTERKKAEDQLKKINEELAEIVQIRTEKLQEATKQASELDSSLREKLREISDYKYALEESSIVAITDAKGIIQHVNQNFCKISRYSSEELIGQDHRIINSGYHGKEFIRHLWATISKGNIWKGELRNKAIDGTIYWVDTTIVPFVDDNGKPYQYLAIRADITQRKIEEEKKIAANRLYKFISQVNQTIVHVTDEQVLFDKVCEIAIKHGQYASAWIGLVNENKPVVNMVAQNGLSAEDYQALLEIDIVATSPTAIVIKTGIHVVYNDIEVAELPGTWQGFMLGRNFLSMGILPIKKKGKVVGALYLFSNKKNTFDEQEMILLEEVAGDVSFAIENFEKEEHKKKLEQQLVKSENYMRSIVEKSADGFILVDAEMQVVYASPNSISILGYPPEEIMGLFRIELVRDDYKQAINDTYQKALDIPHVGHYVEYMMLNKAGHYMWVEASFTNYLDEPAVAAVIINYRDITSRKTQEEKTFAANRLYQFISQVNQSIVHVKTQEELFAKACTTAIGFGGFSMCWIGMINSSLTAINLAAECGANDTDRDTFNHLIIGSTWPISVVLNTEKSFICNNIAEVKGLKDWKKYAMSRGFKSACILPIRKFGVIVGSLNLYSLVTGIFDEQEMVLLDEVVGDISFALENLEKEHLRKQIEERVTKSDLLLNKAQEISHLGSYELNMETHEVTWSEELYRIYGFEPYAVAPNTSFFFSLLHPDDAEWMQKEFINLQTNFGDIANHFRIVHADGSVRHVYSEARFEMGVDGKPETMFGILHDVTESFIAREKLSQSEANMRLIIDLIPHAIVARDRNGNFVFANKRFGELYNLLPEDFLNKNLNDLIPTKEEANEFIVQDRRVIDSGEPIFIPAQTFTDYKGELHIFQNTKVPFTLSGSNEVVALAVAIEITEIVKAQEQLLKSEARHRGIFESQTNYVIRTDLDGNYSFCNNKFIHDFGWIYELKEVIGQPSMISIKEYHHPRVMAAVEQCFTTLNEVVQVELDKPKKDGGVITTLWDFVCLTDAKGQPTEIQCVGTDISDRKKAEEALRESTYILEKAQHVAQVGHWVSAAERNGRVVWSDETYNIFGLDKNKVTGSPELFFSVVHPDDLGKVAEVLQKALSGHGKQEIEHRIVRPDGSIRWVHEQAEMTLDNNGNPDSVVGVVQDITDKKLAEEKIKASEAELRSLNMELEERVFMRTSELIDANQEMEAFSYTVSHDLRTPIRAIQIFGNLLKSKFENNADENIVTYLGNILECTIEMNDLINDLLAFSKLGRHALIKSEVDMKEMAQAVAHSVTSIEEGREFEIDIDYLPNIDADGTLIKSVWLNLISNAVKYARKEVPRTITISSIEERGRIVYVVEDNGIGFDMKYYDKLFKPFSRLHSSSDYKGTGAGLAICDRIIKKHGGEIWAESAVNVGSKFYFSLPINKHQ